MTRSRCFLLSALFLAGVAALGLPLVSSAQSARNRAADVRYEYKVGTFLFNPGEKLNDAQRAAAYEKELNQLAESGWELVGSIQDRTQVQTVGGAVTSRETVSFVAYRRPKR